MPITPTKALLPGVGVAYSGGRADYVVPLVDDGAGNLVPQGGTPQPVVGAVASGDSVGDTRPVVIGGVYDDGEGGVVKAFAAGPDGELPVSATVTGRQTGHPTSGQDFEYPVLIGGVDRDGDIVRSLVVTRAGQALVRPFAIKGNAWQYAPPAGGISNTTTAAALRAAPGDAFYTFVTALQIAWNTLGAGTELVIKDASEIVLWRTVLPAAAGSMGVAFPLPLVTSSGNSVLRAATVTAVTGNVYVNAQGYVEPG